VRPTVAIALLLPTAAGAIEPAGARYLEDADELLWFVQATDTHVGAVELAYDGQELAHLDLFLGEALDTIQPEFAVLTGDLVDASNALGIPSRQFEEEWAAYRGLLDAWGMDASFLHDGCGNHDTYFDDGATYYLANTVLGSTHGSWHELWTAEMSWGSYAFVMLNTADTTHPVPAFDDVGLPPDELAFLDASLLSAAEARLAFTFTHHPLDELDEGADEVVELLAAHRVSAWGNGHWHDHSLTWIDDTLEVNVDTLGKGSVDNLALYAIDHDGLAVRAFDLGEWPMVLVTAPVDASLGGANPWACPVSVNQEANPVRALVFDVQPLLRVGFYVDDGPWQPMEEVSASVWQGSWDCTSLEPGFHQVVVSAVSPSGMSHHAIEVEVAVTECDDGVDNDGNGYADWEDDGGCWGAADDDESGWEPSGDTGLDDTDLPDTGGETGAPEDDTGRAPDTGRDTGAPADVDEGVRAECGCASTPLAAAIPWVLAVVGVVGRRRV